MLAAFLPPYPFRGVAAPYLWWYYRLLARWSGEPAYFVAGRDYGCPVEKWAGRWECEPDAQARLGYRLPEQVQPPQHHYAWLDEHHFDRWLAEAGGNPIAAFRCFLTERDESFEQELRQLLIAAPAPLEAVVTVCNVPALEAVCAEMSIPVVHVELGALRGPLYRETGYVDFRGVNGNTECASRYAGWEGRLPLEREDMLRFFIQVAPDPASRFRQSGWDIGVVLQVEDDSNLVAFGNGMDNVGILAAAKLKAAARELRLGVRRHPGSLFAPRDDSFQLDDSPDSFTFVQRCAHLLTINSSLGLEAILQGKPVHSFGDCSFGFISSSYDEGEQVRRLYFYLFAYLVPFALQLEPEYLRFRLRRPSEESIVLRHLEEYMKQQQLEHKLFSELPADLQAAASVLFANQHKEAQQRITALEKQLAALENQVDSILHSASWKITAPLRRVHQWFFRRSTSR